MQKIREVGGNEEFLPEMQHENVNYSEQLPYDNFNYNYPIDTQEALSNKIVSTANQNKKIIVRKPKVEKMKVAFLELNKQKKPIFIEGMPIVKKIVEYDVFTGVEELELSFPIEGWFNDSTTSSFLEQEEVRVIREIDDLGFCLWSEQVKNPNIDHSEFIGHLFWLKGSFTDAAKGRGGEASKMAKTTITKSETSGWDYNKQEEFNKELGQRRKSGIFGWGLAGIL